MCAESALAKFGACLLLGGAIEPMETRVLRERGYGADCLLADQRRYRADEDPRSSTRTRLRIRLPAC